MEKKKYSLFKLIGIAFLIYAVLTWFIPTGMFSGGEFTKGDVTPLGLYGLFSAPIYSFAVFAQYIVLILCVGGFYGVLNKTGAYQKIVEWFSSKDKIKFLIASIVIFSLVTSVFGETMIIFVLLPFFVTVLMKMGYNKLESLAGTVGGSFIGMVASVTGNLAIYKNYFGLEPKIFILFNIIMLIILIFLLSMFIVSKSNKDGKKNTKNEVIPLFESIKVGKKSSLPLIIVLIFVLLLLILGLFNWYYSFNVEIFAKLHEKIVGTQLFGIDIISKIFGDISEIGYFSNYDVSAILVIASFIISWIYSIKINDFIDAFKNGAKEVLIPAIYVILASVIFSQVVTSSGGNISLTISNFVLGLFKDFNIFTGVLTGILGSFFYNDYLYFINGLYGVVSLYNETMMPFILTVFQSMFGIMMFVLPVSIVLVGGLKYLDVSYKEWIKYIWKFLIQLFIISIIGSIILSMII